MNDPMGQRFWVLLEGMNKTLGYEYATAEVIARTDDEAKDIAMNTPYYNGATPKELGGKVSRVDRREAFDIPSFIRWVSGGIKH